MALRSPFTLRRNLLVLFLLLMPSVARAELCRYRDDDGRQLIFSREDAGSRLFVVFDTNSLFVACDIALSGDVTPFTPWRSNGWEGSLFFALRD